MIRRMPTDGLDLSIDVVKSLYVNRQPLSADGARPADGSAVYRPTARFRETMLWKAMARGSSN